MMILRAIAFSGAVVACRAMAMMVAVKRMDTLFKNKEDVNSEDDDETQCERGFSFGSSWREDG